MPLTQVPGAMIEDLSIDTAEIKDNAVTPSKLSQPLTQGTSQATTSGTSKDFTIPSWAKRITVMLQGVSTNGTSPPRIRLGTGGTPTASGYVGVTAAQITGTSAAGLSAGFDVQSSWATGTNTFNGTFEFSLVSGNTWACTSVLGVTGSGTVGLNVLGGYVTLSGALDIVRLTTVNGTDTFDAGSVNILYQ